MTSMRSCSRFPTRISARSPPASRSKLKPGTMVIVLDAAAPAAGHLPDRPDLTYFITHPCHPPLFNDETDMAAKKDYFGGDQGQAAHRQRPDAGTGSGLRQGRGDRQDDLGAGHALAPRHRRAARHAGAGARRDDVRLAAGSHARRRRRGRRGAASTARRRSTSCSATSTCSPPSSSASARAHSQTPATRRSNSASRCSCATTGSASSSRRRSPTASGASPDLQQSTLNRFHWEDLA